jgi:hypothetical protein
MNQIRRPGTLSPNSLRPGSFRPVTAPQAAIAADRPVAVPASDWPSAPLTEVAVTHVALTWSGRLTADDASAGGQ